MSRTRTPSPVAVFLALVVAAAQAPAGTTDPTPSGATANQAGEVPMDAAAFDPAASDRALAAWRDDVLPDIRAFLAGEREALAAMAADAGPAGDPQSERERNLRCEERKLLGEREVALRQLAWATAFGREALAERLRARVTALEIARPELPAAAARVYGPAAAPRDVGVPGAASREGSR